MATVNYTVRPGDTLWNIAEKFDTSVNDIARYNGISDVNQIYPGQVLRIATHFRWHPNGISSAREIPCPRLPTGTIPQWNACCSLTAAFTTPTGSIPDRY